MHNGMLSKPKIILNYRINPEEFFLKLIIISIFVNLYLEYVESQASKILLTLKIAIKQTNLGLTKI